MQHYIYLWTIYDLDGGVHVHWVNMFAVVMSHHIIKSCKTKIEKKKKSQIRNSQNVIFTMSTREIMPGIFFINTIPIDDYILSPATPV